MSDPIPTSSHTALNPSVSSDRTRNPGADALDRAFEALRTYKYGSSRGSLMPLDEAVAAALGDLAARKALERRWGAQLTADLTPVAKEYLCSKLSLIGSSESVPVLAALLASEDLGQAARATLEALPCAEALNALREGVAKLTGRSRAGVINSLGARRDFQSVPVLTALLRDRDPQAASAAATALGHIGNREAAEALQEFHPKAPAGLHLAIADARLACAERLLAANEPAAALAAYKSLAGAEQPKQIQLAAKRGLLMMLQQK